MTEAAKDLDQNASDPPRHRSEEQIQAVVRRLVERLLAANDLKSFGVVADQLTVLSRDFLNAAVLLRETQKEIDVILRGPGRDQGQAEPDTEAPGPKTWDGTEV